MEFGPVQQFRLAAVFGPAIAALLLTLLCAPATADLSPEVQADLYLVQIEEYIKERDRDAAQESLAAYRSLHDKHGLQLSNDVHFRDAQMSLWGGLLSDAIESLNRYLELDGRSGKHYRQALILMHKATQAMKELEEQVSSVSKSETDKMRRHANAYSVVANLTNLKVVVIPPGSYIMGSHTSEEGRDDAEGPLHQITISDTLAVGVHEVTFAEWDACESTGGCGGHRPDDEGWGRDDRPVINVSWRDAQAFLEWLRGWTGQPYRLLSEAEWEYVARAGSSTPFHTGGTISTEDANYDGRFTYAHGKEGEYRQQTVPVGMFLPNALGLHDTHGNVWEWVEDCAVSYDSAPSDGSARERTWVGLPCSMEKDIRVVRGGSWRSTPTDIRSATRGGIQAKARQNNVGFRVARTLYPDEHFRQAQQYLEDAEQGDTIAQYELGLMYEHGSGVDQSWFMAIGWYKRAAERGYAPAQYSAARMMETYYEWYFCGIRGCDKLHDPTENYMYITNLYVESAEQGYAPSQFKIFLEYKRGTGEVPKDEGEALKWLRKAAEQGHQGAQRLLSHAHLAESVIFADR